VKKLISILLAAIIAVTAVAFTSVAEDNIYVDADFSSDASASVHFYPGACTANDGILVGYKDAMAFQSVGAWASYDTTFDIAFAEDEVAGEDAQRSFSFVYINPNMKHNGTLDDDYSMSVFYDIDKGEISLVGNNFVGNVPGAELISGPVPFEIKDEEVYSFGVSITENEIRVFANGELLIDFVDTENKYFIGYSYEEVEPSILLWWNTNNCTMYHDVKIAAPATLYPFPKPIMYGDANGDEGVNLKDAALMLQHIAKWEGLTVDLTAADVNGDEKVNLSDVSRILQFIAKWEGVVLGPAE